MSEINENGFCKACGSELKVKKNAPAPLSCPICASDLTNAVSEILQNTIECEHIKGMLGTAPGTLYITNKRVFWAKTDNKASISIALGDITKVEDCKKLLRKGVSVHTKSGDAYNFFTMNLANPQAMKDMLSACVSN